MKVLIFDDDISSVDMLLKTVDWESLEIDEFVPVYNVAQAKDAFLAGENIDIMLCDIDAPGENGIELLRWVRQNDYPVENIFFTNYAEFNFAYEAMKLDSVEYILKMSPISVIEDALRRAKGRIQKRLILNDYENVKREKRKVELQHAWLEYLLGDTQNNAAAKLLELADHKLDLNDGYILSLCAFSGVIDYQNGDVEHFLINTANEIVTDGLRGYAFTGKRNENELWIAMSGQSEENCRRALKRLLQYFSKMVPNSLVNAYYSRTVSFKELPAVSRKLEQMQADNVEYNGSVLFLHEEGVHVENYETINFPKEKWMAELKECKQSSLFEKIRQYIVDLQKNQRMNRTVLQEFYTDYMQMIYASLEQQNIQGHRLFKDETARQLNDSARGSVFDMIKWVDFSLKETCNAIRQVEDIKTSIDRVKEYIDKHFCEKIQRNDIASHFYMSEDHLSHAFKKRFAITIPEYVNKRRIEHAVELLRKGCNITDVSNECGFENMSYFSTVFRRIMNITPSEYKKATDLLKK